MTQFRRDSRHPGERIRRFRGPSTNLNRQDYILGSERFHLLWDPRSGLLTAHKKSGPTPRGCEIFRTSESNS